ncbi:MAG: cupin domain-containing protein [Rubrivivax sp.]|nr:cupin domain-containing protein [Rubrivivax sp.]MDP3084769.1 cupin domain-containing protein [Rubrivivax sp.]
MSAPTVLQARDVQPFQRGDGVITTPLITPESRPGAAFTTGLTSFPVGRAAPMHSHNCDEQVTILEGQAEVVLEDRRLLLGPMDTTYIPANHSHCFNNVGEGRLVILWIYASDHVTRTFSATGQTVEHLSQGDKVN